MDQAGVVSIDLTISFTGEDKVNHKKNIIFSESFATFSDGSTSIVGDVGLVYEKSKKAKNVSNNNETEVEIKSLDISTMAAYKEKHFNTKKVHCYTEHASSSCENFDFNQHIVTDF